MRYITPEKRKFSRTAKPVSPGDLLASPLFRDLETEWLEKLAADSQFFRCDPEYKLICENDDEPALIIIHSGCVRVRRSVNGKERVIGFLEKGSVIGEINLLNHRPHTADVVAETDMTGIAVNPQSFTDCLAGSRWLYRNLAECLAEKICVNDVHTAKREGGDFKGKCEVALAIERLITIHGFQPDGQTINHPITHEELADLAGFSRSRTTETIRDLAARHLIANEKRHIRVLDRARLNLFAAGDHS